MSIKKGKIHLPRTRYFIEVFCWPTREEMQRKTKGKREKLNYGAIYKPEPYTISPRKRVGNKLGEIHLYHGRTGIGLLSHEALHCIFDYIVKSSGKDTVNVSDNLNQKTEKLCFLEGEIVRRIGNWLIKVKEWKYD